MGVKHKETQLSGLDAYLISESLVTIIVTINSLCATSGSLKNASDGLLGCTKVTSESVRSVCED